MGFEVPLWRAIAVFRVVALVYAAALIVPHSSAYRHPAGGWAVLAVMAGWTGYAVHAYRAPSRRTWRLLVADLAVAAGCLLSTTWVETADRLHRGAPTLTAAWVAGAVLAWAVSGGKRRGTVAAAVIGVAGVSVPGLAGLGFRPTPSTFNGIVLVFMAGVVVGHVAKLGIDAEARLAQAIEVEAATRERERLARRIHDSVLQVLTLVQRRGGELGGEAAELGRLAGEQEAALRALIGAPDPSGDPGGQADLRGLLQGYSSMTVTVSAPATPVRLPGRTARELQAAVGAALDNVARHCGSGTRAWVLVEQAGETVTVSIRDDGPGIPPGRTAEAAADGRLGIAQSIRGRVRDLGGTVAITSAPGEGTEIEMSVPAG
ncbi:MacS family sensor histidine kinase [Actinomadura scrupuli]|uniref:MacS family sensor histidine kinase n=1 Tax=Actinomadura scrupuli TaxID=559629 RepID=UPI003D976CAA